MEEGLLDGVSAEEDEGGTGYTPGGAEGVGAHEEEKEQPWSDEFMLLLSFVSMVFVGLGNKLFQVFQTLPVHNYPNTLNLISTFIYIPICFGYVAAFPSHVTEEARRVPKKVFAIMGIYDAVGGVLVTFSVNFITKRTLIVLLQQTAIPISMIISRVSLNTRYNVYQYVGAVVVILGLVVVLYPSFASKEEQKQGGGSEMVWMALLVASNIPVCLSSVYKEKVLGDTDVNVLYLNGWVSLFQFILCFPSLIPGALSMHVSIRDIPSHFVDGLKCIVGVNSIVNSSEHPCYPADSGFTPACDECGLAPLFVSLYLAFNVGYNMLMIMILKYGDSNTLWLSMTFMVPLVNFVFYIPSIPGHQSPKVTDLVGLLIICMGLVLYRFSSALQAAMKKCCKRSKAGYVRLFDSPRTPRTIKRDEHTRFIVRQRLASRITVAGNVQPAEGVQTALHFTVTSLRPRLRRTPVQIRNRYLQRVGVDSESSPARRMRANSRS